MSQHRYTLVAAVNSRTTLERNLLASPALDADPPLQRLFKEGAASASQAYNAALDEAEGDIVVFAHQDVYLPAAFFRHLDQAIDALDAAGEPWGVLGCFGSRHDVHGGVGRVCDRGLGVHGGRIAAPMPVETLDEIVLVLRKASGLRFDPAFPHFHLYGVDLCMSARAAGLRSYVVPTFCVHNTNQLLRLPDEFYACYRIAQHKWARFLPISASCMTITASNYALRRRRCREWLDALLPARRRPLARVDDPTELLAPAVWQALAAGQIPDRTFVPRQRRFALRTLTPEFLP